MYLSISRLFRAPSLMITLLFSSSSKDGSFINKEDCFQTLVAHGEIKFVNSSSNFAPNKEPNGFDRINNLVHAVES